MKDWNSEIEDLEHPPGLKTISLEKHVTVIRYIDSEKERIKIIEMYQSYQWKLKVLLKFFLKRYELDFFLLILA